MSCSTAELIQLCFWRRDLLHTRHMTEERPRELHPPHLAAAVMCLGHTNPATALPYIPKVSSPMGGGLVSRVLDSNLYFLDLLITFRGVNNLHHLPEKVQFFFFSIFLTSLYQSLISQCNTSLQQSQQRAAPLGGRRHITSSGSVII